MLYLLYENSVGLALFKKKGFDELASDLPQIRKATSSMDKFSEMVTLHVNL